MPLRQREIYETDAPWFAVDSDTHVGCRGGSASILGRLGHPQDLLQFIPEEALENSDIDVEYKRGAVTLHGSVPTQAAKDRAAAVAKATHGVRSVKDNLRVARAGGVLVRDGWIKARVAAQFVTETALDNSDIDIDVGRGAVTLIGTVSSEAAGMRAESMAKATDGVKSVRNNLKVSAPGR